jgi:predicted nucleic acid-binding protein
VTRRERGGSLSPAQGSAIVGHFRKRVDRRDIIVELSPTLLDDASHLAQAHALRGYDAVHLAAATTLNRRRLAFGLGTVTLVSADAELNRAAGAEGLSVEDSNCYP